MFSDGLGGKLGSFLDDCKRSNDPVMVASTRILSTTTVKVKRR